MIEFVVLLLLVCVVGYIFIDFLRLIASFSKDFSS